jgi:DNA (cytosine-5)-methyltransferase 1
MNHIELFAGCGGLSLGLESAGFDLLLANELSPMASETFAYNFLDENLAEPSTLSNIPVAKRKTKWLNSQYPVTELEQRLKEDPRDYPALGRGFADVDVKDPMDLKGNLIVGSIVQLNSWLASKPDVLCAIRKGFDDGDGVDLVSGGPPCQSFSMAGMREFDNARNILPMEFAKFVEHVQPRMALLENVSGILRPFDVKGKKVHAWYEVAKAFAGVGYIPLCVHVNAKQAGVAQSRPRFLMIIFRPDVYDSFMDVANPAEKELLEPSKRFFELAAGDNPIEFGELEYFDVGIPRHLDLFKKSFLKSLVKLTREEDYYTVRDAIDDMNEVSRAIKSEYVLNLEKYFGDLVMNDGTENTEQPKSTPRVIRRFRIYQNLANTSDRAAVKEAQAVLAGEVTEISSASYFSLAKFKYLGEDGKDFYFKKGDAEGMAKYFAQHITKKRTQKALDPSAPAPAALSIPDDACHYDALRTLSVREMARFQSFPDNFAFRSKVTTGGQMRKFQVPQYTQVGNAVPPLLGRALGFALAEVLQRASAAKKSSNKVKKVIARVRVPA